MSRDMGIFTLQTKSGPRYRVKWRRPDGTQASKTFRTKREAKDFKQQVEFEKSRGTLPDYRRSKVKFSTLADEVHRVAHHSESTTRRREGIMKNYILPTLGSMPINQIKRTDIIRLVHSWTEAGLLPRTITNHLNVMRPIFKEAVFQDIIVRNPMDGISAPKAGQVRRNPLTPEECWALINAMDESYRFAIEFALATGVRWSEFANLRIRDFKPFKKVVFVTDSKTDAGIRKLPLDDDDCLMISKHIADTGRNGADADSPLFTSPNGKPLHYSNFRRRVFIPACERAGLIGVTFHDLRRTHATMLVAQGHDVKVVQERMGHRSISTTLAYYAKATEQGTLDAAGAKKRYLAKGQDVRLRDAQ